MTDTAETIKIGIQTCFKYSFIEIFPRYLKNIIFAIIIKKATTIETKKGINGLCKNFRIIYETGTFNKNKPPKIIWYHFNFPIAWIPVEMGSVSDIIRASIRASFANITVYSGTFFNHNLNMYSIFVIKGIEIINSRKNDIFEAEQEILKKLNEKEKW